MDIAIPFTRRDNTHTRLHIFYHLYKTHDWILTEYKKKTQINYFESNKGHPIDKQLWKNAYLVKYHFSQ